MEIKHISINKQKSCTEGSIMGRKELNIQSCGVVNPETGVAGVGYVIHDHSPSSKSIPYEQRNKIALGGINEKQAGLLSIQHALSTADNMDGDHIELQTPCEYPPNVTMCQLENQKIEMYVDTIEDLRDRFESCEIRTVPINKTRATVLAHEATRE